MIIKALYAEPAIFDKIEFKTGINFITGEKSDENDGRSSQKTNAVGKSFVIDFIDFCLLSDYKKARISRIPKDIVSDDTFIILEFNIEEKNVIVKRNIKKYDSPIIYLDNVSQEFNNINDARQFLNHIIFNGDQVQISFREMISLYKRAEVIGYRDYLTPDDNKSLLIPCLYLLNIDVELYLKTEQVIKKLHEANENMKALKTRIEVDNNISFNDVKKEINDLSGQLRTLDDAVETLNQKDIYQTISHDIATLDTKIENKTTEMITTKEELNKIEEILQATSESIDEKDIAFIYNDIKDNLGNFIVKEIKEIQSFKDAIDEFKNQILQERKVDLLGKEKSLLTDINSLSTKYQKTISVLDQTGDLRSLKTLIQEYDKKKTDFSRISNTYEDYQSQAKNRDELKKTRNTLIEQLQVIINSIATNIKLFEEMVLKIHHIIYENDKASFVINAEEPRKITDKKFINIVLNTDSDQSSTGMNERTIIFDLALLFSRTTSDRHLKFLIHDSAFNDISPSTVIDVLNWLHSQQETFQYIVTINRDRFESLEKDNKLNFDINSLVRANYSKEPEQKRFLKKKFTLNKK